MLPFLSVSVFIKLYCTFVGSAFPLHCPKKKESKYVYVAYLGEGLKVYLGYLMLIVLFILLAKTITLLYMCLEKLRKGAGLHQIDRPGEKAAVIRWFVAGFCNCR